MPAGIAAVKITASNETKDAFDKVKESLSQLHESSNSLSETLKTAFEAVGIELTISSFVEMTKRIVETTAAFGLMAEKTGISAKALSGLDYAASQTGVTSDALQNGLKLLSKNLVDASNGVAASADSFKALGISTKDASGNVRPLQDVLLDVAAKFHDSEDGATKAKIALQLFGRSGTDMIPFLNKGRDGIQELTAKAEELGITIDGETAAAMDHFEAQLKTMAAQSDAAKLALVSGMVPAMEQIIGSFTQGKDRLANFNQAGKEFGTFLKTATGYVFDFAYSFDYAYVKIQQFSGQLMKLMTGVDDPEKGNYANILASLAQQHADSLNSLDATPAASKTTETGGGSGQLHLANTAEIEKEAALKLKLIGLTQQLGSIDEQLAKKEGDAAKEIVDLYSRQITEVQKLVDEYKAAADANPKLTELADQYKKFAATAAQEIQKLTIEEQIELNKLPIIIENALNKAGAAFVKANVLDVPITGVRTIAEYGQQIQTTFRAITQEEKAVSDQGKAWGASQFIIDQQLKPLREKEIKDLQAIVDLYTALAKGSKDPTLIEEAKKYAAQLDILKTKAQGVGDIIQKDFYQQGLAAFQGIVTQTTSVSDAFSKMALSIVQDIEKMITEMLFFKAISGLKAVFGGVAGGSSGAGFDVGNGGFMGLAGGGDFAAGTPLLVGENGPELMVPTSPGSVIPNGSLSKMGGGNTYYINAQNAQPGVERDIMRAIKASEDRAVVRSVRSIDSRSKRTG
jgi:minor tail protein